MATPRKEWPDEARHERDEIARLLRNLYMLFEIAPEFNIDVSDKAPRIIEQIFIEIDHIDAIKASEHKIWPNWVTLGIPQAHAILAAINNKLQSRTFYRITRSDYKQRCAIAALYLKILYDWIEHKKDIILPDIRTDD